MTQTHAFTQARTFRRRRPALGPALGRFRARLSLHFERHDAIQTLEGLPDHLLKDMGVRRHQIRERVYGHTDD